MLPATSRMRVTLEFFQEHAPSVRSVTSVTQDLPRACSLQMGPMRRVSEPDCVVGYLADSGWFQLRAIGNHAVLEVTPQGDRQAPCDRDDGNASGTAVGAGALRAPVEPLGECAAGLVAQPGPGHLDQ